MTANQALIFLLDIGLSEAEIANRIGRDVRCLKAISDAADQLIDTKLANDLVQLARAEAHQYARSALDTLLHMGISQKAIALDLGYNEGTISRLRNEPEWPIGVDLAIALRRKLAVEEDKRAVEDLARLALSVIDTCPDRQKNLQIDEKFKSSLVRAFRAALKAAFTNSLPSEVLPDGCLGALASVGHPRLWLYMMLLRAGDVGVSEFGQPSQSLEARHLRALVHELRDLIRRLQTRIDRLEGRSYRPDAAF